MTNYKTENGKRLLQDDLVREISSQWLLKRKDEFTNFCMTALDGLREAGYSDMKIERSLSRLKETESAYLHHGVIHSNPAIAETKQSWNGWVAAHWSE